MSKYLETRFLINAGNIYGYADKRIKLVSGDTAEIEMCGYKITIEPIEKSCNCAECKLERKKEQMKWNI